jgi:hypothetical protein
MHWKKRKRMSEDDDDAAEGEETTAEEEDTAAAEELAIVLEADTEAGIADDPDATLALDVAALVKLALGLLLDAAGPATALLRSGPAGLARVVPAVPCVDMVYRPPRF